VAGNNHSWDADFPSDAANHRMMAMSFVIPVAAGGPFRCELQLHLHSKSAVPTGQLLKIPILPHYFLTLIYSDHV
jgi:hypothetical protein